MWALVYAPVYGRDWHLDVHNLGIKPGPKGIWLIASAAKYFDNFSKVELFCYSICCDKSRGWSLISGSV